MNRPLRHLSRSPILRLMAALAWLLLVVMPIHGSEHCLSTSTVTAMPAMHDMGDTTAADGHAQPTSANAAQHASCCPDSDGSHGAASGCHCAATFGTVLAAAGVRELTPMKPASVRPLVRTRMAPDIADGPPLRPPAV